MEKEKKVRQKINWKKEMKTGSWIYRDHLVGYLYIYAAWMDSCSESFNNN